MAETGSVVTTAEEDGHDVYILEKVYLKLTTKPEAKKHFGLSPKVCGKKDWYKHVKAIIEDIPDVLARKVRTKRWKKIGDGPQGTIEEDNHSKAQSGPRSKTHPR